MSLIFNNLEASTQGFEPSIRILFIGFMEFSNNDGRNKDYCSYISIGILCLNNTDMVLPIGDIQIQIQLSPS